MYLVFNISFFTEKMYHICHTSLSFLALQTCHSHVTATKHDEKSSHPLLKTKDVSELQRLLRNSEDDPALTTLTHVFLHKQGYEI